MSPTLWFLLEYSALLAAAAVVFTWLGWIWRGRGQSRPDVPPHSSAPLEEASELHHLISSLREENTRLFGQLQATPAPVPVLEPLREKELESALTRLEAEKASLDAKSTARIIELEASVQQLRSDLAAKMAEAPAPPAPPAAPTAPVRITPKPAAAPTKSAQLSFDLLPKTAAKDALTQERDDWLRRVAELEKKTPPDLAGLALARRSLEGSQKRLDAANLIRDGLENQQRAKEKAAQQAAQLPPEAGDDLTRIKGIKKVLRDQLLAHGIRTWRQIAEWDADDLRAFSEILSFKNRAVRDRWQEQARELHEATHGPL
ncbi:MAG: hypothetical protein IPK32_14215 [Verrucomicrobiaceae bacterium]|nr:hypothetical protein [Verrucomicrobiaceae bacterium]